MQRAITAIYRTRATAELVRDEVKALGIHAHDVTILPDRETLAGDATAPGMAASTAGRTDDALDGLHDLHLPEDDTRTYQQAIRNGDVVVSVSLDDEGMMSRVQEIMRNPEEAYDLDTLDTQYRTAEFRPRMTEPGYDATDMRGERLQDSTSSRTRSYSRNAPLHRRDEF